jgi:Lhr-like helicase
LRQPARARRWPDSWERLPWAGHSARHAIVEIYDRIKSARLALVFVNTRSQAERSTTSAHLTERFDRIRRNTAGLWRIANARAAQLYRLKIGTIVEETMLKIRLIANAKGLARSAL